MCNFNQSNSQWVHTFAPINIRSPPSTLLVEMAVRAVTARLRPLASVLMLPGVFTFYGDPITNFEDLCLLVLVFFLIFACLWVLTFGPILQADLEGSLAFLYHSQFEAHKSVSDFVGGMLPVLFDVMRHIKDRDKLVNIFEDRSFVRGFSLLVKVNQTHGSDWYPSLTLFWCVWRSRTS